MKSAYELAMERLEQDAPAIKLTDEQRTELADIEKRFQAKIAEKEVFLQGLIDKAEAEQNLGESAELRQQLTAEVSRLNADMEEAKEKVRQSG